MTWFGAVVLVVGWLAGWVLAWHLPTLAATAAPSDTSTSITVIVPARDEERSLPLLLADLASHRRPPDQLVVVDDGSTDGTAAAVRAHHGATLVTGLPLPPGWAGKPWALDQGVAAATGDLLVFIDADVRLAPGALDGLVTAHAGRGGEGLLSVAPWHATERWWERFSALPNLVAVMGTGAAWPGRHGRTDVAFGPCLAIGRADLARVGGMAAVAGEVIEDVALARRVAALGLPVTAVAGAGLVSYRMYPNGPRQLVEGWTKNLAAGAGGTPPAALAAAVLWVGALVSSLPGALMGLIDADRARIGLAVIGYLAFAAQLTVLLRRVGRFGPSPVLLHPLHGLVFMALVARSAWLLVVRRQVRWRGRDLAVGRGRPGPPRPEGQRA